MPFVENLWYVAAWADEIGENLLGRMLVGRPVLLYRTAAGKPVAIGNACPHRFAPLSLGRRCEDDRIECAYHGLRFDTSGVCTHNPHDDGHIPAAARVPCYPVVERYGILWIWIGDPKRANPDRIANFDQITNPALRTITGMMTVQANYELVADNLLDLSHTQFVHANFFRADTVLSARHDVTQQGSTVHSRRWMANITAPPAIARNLADPTAKVDHWIRVRWDAPGLHRLDVGATLAGAPEGEGLRSEGSHLLTPETETTTHYFYANTRNTRVNDPEADKNIREWHRIGFGEQDKPMIEAVQKMMGGPDLMARHPVLLSVDTAAIRARRIMDQLRAAQIMAEPANAAA